MNGSGLGIARRSARDRRLIPKAGPAAAAQDDWVAPDDTDNLEPSPPATRAANGAAPSSAFDLAQIFVQHRHSPLTIERRARDRGQARQSDRDPPRGAAPRGRARTPLRRCRCTHLGASAARIGCMASPEPSLCAAKRLPRRRPPSSDRAGAVTAMAGTRAPGRTGFLRSPDRSPTANPDGSPSLRAP